MERKLKKMNPDNQTFSLEITGSGLLELINKTAKALDSYMQEVYMKESFLSKQHMNYRSKKNWSMQFSVNLLKLECLKISLNKLKLIISYAWDFRIFSSKNSEGICCENEFEFCEHYCGPLSEDQIDFLSESTKNGLFFGVAKSFMNNFLPAFFEKNNRHKLQIIDKFGEIKPVNGERISFSKHLKLEGSKKK